MFEQTFVQTQAATRRPWTVAMSLSLQVAAVGVILLIPLLRPAVLRIPDAPKAPLISTWASLAPPPQRVAARTHAPVTPSAVRVPKIYYPTLQSPTPVARQIDVPAAETSAVWQSGPVGLPQTGLPTQISLPPTKPAAAPPPTPAKPTAPVRVSGGVESAKLLYSPHPAYPRLAVLARSEGTVRLEAIIATDGRIRNLRVLSGPTLLVDAALDAVRQWKYQPTLLNGAPVEVVTDIEVNFTLSR
jgi:protein TonB